MKKPNLNSRLQTSENKERGMMLIIVLIFFAISSYSVLKSSEVWATVIAREQEQELLFVGNQYRLAIERYYYASKDSIKVLPKTLQDLVEDNRFPVAQHHLRKLYSDPMLGSDFEIRRVGNGIVGVNSKSNLKPIKKSDFDVKYRNFETAATYRNWIFVFTPPAPVAPVSKPQTTGTQPKPI